LAPDNSDYNRDRGHPWPGSARLVSGSLASARCPCLRDGAEGSADFIRHLPTILERKGRGVVRLLPSDPLERAAPPAFEDWAIRPLARRGAGLALLQAASHDGLLAQRLAARSNAGATALPCWGLPGNCSLGLGELTGVTAFSSAGQPGAGWRWLAAGRPFSGSAISCAWLDLVWPPSSPCLQVFPPAPGAPPPPPPPPPPWAGQAFLALPTSPAVFPVRLGGTGSYLSFGRGGVGVPDQAPD